MWIFDIRYSNMWIFDIRYSVFEYVDIRYSIFGIRYSIFGIRYSNMWIFDIRYSVFEYVDIRYSIFGIRICGYSIFEYANVSIFKLIIMKRQPRQIKRADQQVKSIDSQNYNEDDIINRLSSVIEKVSERTNFETLLYKVDKIEEAQGRVVTKIEDIHNAIYDPDQGVFAKIKQEELSRKDDLADVDVRLQNFAVWRENVNQDFADGTTETHKTNEDFKNIQNDVRDLVQWRQRSSAVSKWIIISLSGAVITLGFKLLYDVIIQHVVFK